MKDQQDHEPSACTGATAHVNVLATSSSDPPIDDNNKDPTGCHPEATATKCSFDGSGREEEDAEVDAMFTSKLASSNMDDIEKGVLARGGAPRGEGQNRQPVSWSKQPGVAMGLLCLLIFIMSTATGLFLWLSLRAGGDIDDNNNEAPSLSITIQNPP